MNSSSDLENSISELLAVSISNETKKEPVTIKDMEDLMDRLVLESEAESQRCKQKDFVCKARTYFLLSRVMSEAAQLVKNTDISNVLKVNSESWSDYADTLLSYATVSLIDEAHQYEQSGEYDKYTRSKTEAKQLEYELKAGIVRTRLERQATDLVRRRIEDVKNNSDLQAKTREVQNLVERYITSEEKSRSSFISGKKIFSEAKHIADGIKIRNEAKRSSKGEDIFDWSVFLYNENEEALKELLKEVQSVTYTLHPTFPKPIINLGPEKRSDKFKLKATGWGEFEIKVDIQLNTGDRFTKYHWLDLSQAT